MTEHTGRPSFSEAARALMAEQGISVRGLARRVAYDPGYMSRVLRGERPPSHQLAELLDTELGANGALLDTVLPSPNGQAEADDGDPFAAIDPLSLAWLVGRLDVEMDRRTVLRMATGLTGTPLVNLTDSVRRITGALSGPSRLDESVLHRIDDRGLGFHRLEALLPARQVFPGLVSHIDEITSLLQTCHHAPTRKWLLRALGESTVLGAWLAWDLGDPAQAANLHRATRAAAREADDPAITACAAIYRSFAVDPAPARRLLASARDALPQQHAPATWAWLAAREAEEAAALGDAKAGPLALTAAEHLSAARPQQERPWTRCLTDPTWSGIRLTVASRLGDEASIYELLEEMHLLTGDTTQKGAGRKLASMALALVRVGDVTEGVTLGHRAADAIRGTHATYALPRLAELGDALAARSTARDLQESITATQQAVSPRPAIPGSP